MQTVRTIYQTRTLPPGTAGAACRRGAFTLLPLVLIASLAPAPLGARPSLKPRARGARPVLTLRDANHPVISADGRRIAVVPEIGLTHVYDVETGRRLHAISVARSYGHAISSDGRRLALFTDVITSVVGDSYEARGEVWFYDLDSGEKTGRAVTDLESDGARLGRLSVYGGAGEGMENYSSDLRLVANRVAGGFDLRPGRPAVFLADLAGRRIVRGFGRLDLPLDNWRQVSLTPDGRVLAATRSNINHPGRNVTVVWEAAGGRELTRLPFDSWWLALSADGRRLVTRRSAPPDGATTALSVTPEGRLRAEVVAPAGPERREPHDPVEIWDTATGRRVSEVGADFGAVSRRPPMVRGALSPDGKLLATRSGNYVMLWDADTGRLAAAQPHSADPREDTVKTVVFSNDGRLVVAGSFGEVTKVWRVPDVLREARVGR